jgi:Peptidase family M28/PKD domain
MSKPRLTERAIAAISMFALLALLLVACASPTTSVKQTPTPSAPMVTSDAPAIDPDYIYDQLATMTSRFQHREAGYDTGLPPEQNGHDEYAGYWIAEMTRVLAGFGPTSYLDPFPVAGWVNRPAPKPASNVEVTVPGITHPEQIAVVGCHYDGEAVSTQSANDDASGCAIMMGVAKALADYWRAKHVAPSRTIKFVLFDAEEQGLYGSFHYVNQTINRQLGEITAMFNEEQSGIAYPLRFLGKAGSQLLPFYVETAPLRANELYGDRPALTAQQRDAITRFRSLISGDLPATFDQFRSRGYTTLTYRSTSGSENQPIFTRDDLRNVQVMEDAEGGSDQIPFTLAGLPCVTFVGDSDYYQPHPHAWAYPYDQAQDTLQLMNVFASGKEAKSEALALALALPGALSAWLLHQPDILGEAPADQLPRPAIADLGQLTSGANLSFDARPSFDPAGGKLTYDWDFGDGGKVTGETASHTYAKAGSYTLKLTAHSSAGSRSLSMPLAVSATPPSYPNPYANYQATGSPRPNPDVTLPTPEP